MKKLAALCAILLLASTASTAFATSGRTDKNGCHTDRKGGSGYHCH